MLKTIEETDMKFGIRALTGFGLLLLSSTASLADCGIASGSVRILSNDFDSLRVVASAAEECASDKVKVTKNQTAEHKNLQVAALKANPAEYTVAVVANNSVVPLLNEGLIRPLDDYVAKYGQDLQPNQLIKIDGKVMAIAFMANGQHLFMRKDLLDKAGVAVPKSYEDVLAAAKTLKEKGVSKFPLGAADKAGWDLAAEFVNMYLGHGGDFFEPGSAKLAINNEKGKASLAMMRSLTAYMSPDYITYGADELNKDYQNGKLAIVNNWGSIAGSILDAKATLPEVTANTVFSGAPTVGGGKIPAAALWWDGFTIAKNVSDEDAEASFRAMVHGISPAVIAKNPNAATWLVKGYTPGVAAAGVIASANGGSRPYPMVPYMGLLHTALSTELADFIKGSEDADKAMADVEAAYNTAAKEAGYLN
jgi:multiple sugar transport system substrate-binding protein